MVIDVFDEALAVTLYQLLENRVDCYSFIILEFQGFFSFACDFSQGCEEPHGNLQGSSHDYQLCSPKIKLLRTEMGY